MVPHRAHLATGTCQTRLFIWCLLIPNYDTFVLQDILFNFGVDQDPLRSGDCDCLPALGASVNVGEPGSIRFGRAHVHLDCWYPDVSRPHCYLTLYTYNSHRRILNHSFNIQRLYRLAIWPPNVKSLCELNQLGGSEIDFVGTSTIWTMRSNSTAKRV